MTKQSRRGLRRWIYCFITLASRAVRGTAAWLRRSSSRSYEPADTASAARFLAPDWTEAHKLAWAHFLASQPGMDLMARARVVAMEVSQKACADAFHTSHSAGTAHGWNEALAWLESLSRTSRVNDEAARPKNEPDPTDMQSPRRGELYELFAP